MGTFGGCWGTHSKTWQVKGTSQAFILPFLYKLHFRVTNQLVDVRKFFFIEEFPLISIPTLKKENKNVEHHYFALPRETSRPGSGHQCLLKLLGERMTIPELAN